MSEINVDNNRINVNNNSINVNNNKNKYIQILDFWNSKEVIKHRPLKPILKRIKIAYKKYGKDKIIQAIENYYTI